MIHLDVNDFIRAISLAAGDHPVANKAIQVVKKTGREAHVIRSIESTPRLSEEDFDQMLPQIRERAGLFNIPDSEVPSSYSEYLEMEKEASRNTISTYKIKYPDDMNDSEIAICAVPESAQEYLLPGYHLAGYARDIVIDGVTPRQGHHRVMFSVVDCDSFWLGLEGVHAVTIYVLRSSVEEERDIETVVGEIVQKMMLGKYNGYPEDQDANFQLIADLLLQELLEAKLPGFTEGVKTYQYNPSLILANSLHNERYIQSVRNATHFVLEKLIAGAFPRPASELEKNVREVIIFRVCAVTLLPMELVLELFKQVGLARPQPFILR